MPRKIISFVLISFLLFFPCFLAWELYSLDKTYFFCPIKYKQDTIIIRHDYYGNGEYQSPRRGGRKHNGIDLQAKIGSWVYAVRSGKVLEARFHKGMGNYVKILHPYGYTTVYGHLLRITVKKDQFVRQGDKIGEVGKTGNARQSRIIPHLHFEIKKNGNTLSPMEFLE